MALNPVQKWLQSILGPYRYRDEVYADVDRTLQAIPSLSPRTDTYTYDDGRTVLLLTLQGTIPISFRGVTYNIPVAYWIPHAYPREAPIAYVVPAANMLVRQSAQVDLSGLIKADFLQAWSRKWEGNNLLLLTETLQAIFSREPPLYAKPTQQPTTNGYAPSSPTPGPSQPPSRQAGGPRPPPPPPVASIGPFQASQSQPRSPTAYDSRQGSLSPTNTSQPVPNAQGPPGPPGRPQKPWINGQNSPLSPNGTHHRSASMSSAHQTPPGQSFSPHQAPPRPPIPHVYEHSRSASAGQAGPSRQPSLHVQPVASYQTSTRSPPPQQGYHGHPVQQQQQAFYSPQSPASPYYAQSINNQGTPGISNARQGPAPVASPPQQHLQPPFQQQQYQSQPNRQASISSSHTGQPSNTGPQAPYIPPRPDQFRSSASPGTPKSVHSQRLTTPVNILDEDDDPSHASSSTSQQALPPPPRPTNPALLNMRRALYAQLVHHLHTLQAHLDAENEHLRALHNDLLKGEPAILDEMQRLEAVKDVCTSVRDRMNDVVGTAQRNIEDLSTRPETEVDELVCGTNVVHNQLLELVAEDNALEDAIYHLSRYFNSDTRTQEELERFLKRTRILAREQFMKRSLINKILLDIALSRAQRS